MRRKLAIGVCQLSLAALFCAASLLNAQSKNAPPQPNQPNQKPSAEREGIQDDPSARRRWMLETYGDPRVLAERRIREGERQRQLYPAQVPGGLSGARGTPKVFSGPTWVSLGPTTASYTINGVKLFEVDSGRLRTILPHPTDPNTVYILAAGGGLWKTSNFLSTPPTWTPLTDSISTTAGGAAAFGASSQTIYLGLGDPFDNAALAGGAMVKSIDGGNTWSATIQLPNNCCFTSPSSSVRDVKIDAGAGTGGQDVVLVATDIGMFRSVDGGSTYSPVLDATTFFALEFWSIVKTSAGWLASSKDYNNGGAGALWLSTDHGNTWGPINNTGGVISNVGRITLGVGTPNDSVVYAFAATAGDGAQRDLFRSTDGGQSWTALNLPGITPTNPNGDQPDMDIMHGQAFYNHMLLVDPSDGTRNTVYIGGNLSSAKSTDGGTTWTIISNWLPGGNNGTASLPYVHADFHAAAFSNIGNNKTLFFGSDGGLFVSTDNGATWSSKKNIGLVTHLHYSVASNPTQPASTISGLQDNGTRVREGSTSIFDQTIGGDGFGAGSGQANNLVTLESYVHDAIRSSADLGLTWIPAQNGINTGDTGFVTDITTPTAGADPTGKVFFTTGLSDVYETADGAKNWVSIGHTGINFSAAIRKVVHAVGVSPLDTNHIAVAGTGGVLITTADGGATWTEHSLGALVPGYNLSNANVAWANNSLLYACSVAPQAGSVRVVKSIDGGANWTAAATSLPDLPVEELAVDPRDATGNTVYAATFIGVYRTINGGTGWSLFGSGLPPVDVRDMYISPNGTFLRIATFGRGIWEINFGQPTHFSVTALANASAGVPFSVTVRALDASNTVVPGYTGAVHFTSNDGGATLPADYTFVSGDNGIHTFTSAVTLVALGSHTVTATDTVSSSITGSASVNVGVGPTSRFVVVAPGAATAGTGFTFTVTAKDQFGNTTPAYGGTVHFTSSDGAAVLAANSTLASGAGTFAATLKTSGNQTITATDTVTSAITGVSGTIVVSAAAATHYSLTAPPTATINTAFTFSLTALDQFNNTAKTYTGTAHFTSSDGAVGVVLPANYTFQAADNGQKTFANGVTLRTLGAQTITATDTVTASVTATASLTVVNDAPITGQGRTIRIFRANVPAIVASFTDADVNETSNHLSATINWGDGTPLTAAMVARVGATNVFNVIGTHTYAKKGRFAVTVTMQDSQGSVAVANSTASFLPRTFSF